MANTELISTDLADAAAGLHDDVVELRRAIHAEPELGLDLPATQEKITETLTGLGLDITLGTSSSSVVADLDTGRAGPTVLLRGDMDALPLQEDHPSEFRSTHDGRMHACGHDAHVSMLAGAARMLAENAEELSGRVRFMFQPGEEGHHGARHMIDEGVLADVDRAFAIHVFTNMPNGIVATKGGPVLASADEFEITIHGEGGHASAPHNCVDPIPAAAATITSLHTMVGRAIEATRSGLVTVAHVEAGTTTNVIPPTAFMEGTIRTLDEMTRATLHGRIAEVVEGTAAAHGCTCTTQITPGYPVTVNHDDQAELVADVSRALLGEDRYADMPHPVMGAEDFSYVLQHVPGAMAFMGVCPDDEDWMRAAPNHSNLMQVNESALTDGVALYAAMAIAG